MPYAYTVDQKGLSLLVVVSFLFGAGMLTYILAIILEIQAGGPMYLYLATAGAALSIAATFFGVLNGVLRS